jgi:AraC-like DNA-binding protein
LRETREPVTEIAIALGYQDAANFTRAFRRYAGCSPTAFRAANAAPRGDVAVRAQMIAGVRETSRA